MMAIQCDPVTIQCEPVTGLAINSMQALDITLGTLYNIQFILESILSIV
jgi:hypothetical protein